VSAKWNIIIYLNFIASETGREARAITQANSLIFLTAGHVFATRAVHVGFVVEQNALPAQHHSTAAPYCLILHLNRLGGVVVSLLATGTKGSAFELGQGDGFLRAIKIRSTSSSRMGSKAGRSHVVRFYSV
jgi:hypothetical protein